MEERELWDKGGVGYVLYFFFCVLWCASFAKSELAKCVGVG